MCGINGFVYTQPTSEEANRKQIQQMNSLIIYRGPDDDGVFVDASVALGMRRLSIIDLCTGKQPIYNEDRSKVIVFNGELYNFKELRSELLAKGHRFSSESDTEVILHAYEEFGEACLNRLNGMFAFAIYDLKEKELLLARDRAGEKPLYYYRDNEKLIFASELKSIIKVFDVGREISVEALNQFFSFTYIPSPLTIFRNLYKLEAGHFIKYKNGVFHKQCYWDIEVGENSFIHDYEECKKRLREYLFESVEKKMISDVPLGAFLSGGIDSSIIVGIMSKLSSKPIETFSIGFKMKDFDESDKAKLVAQKNGTNHHVHFLDYDDTLDELDKIIGTLDEPFADSSAIPTYFVSKFARQQVTVVLSGDAGDELFGGYSKYMIHHYARMYNKIPGVLRKHLIEKLVYAMPDRSSKTRKLRKVIENSRQGDFERRRNLMYLGFQGQKRSQLLKNYYYIEDIDGPIRRLYERNLETDELTRTLFTDYKLVLEGDMLTKVDRMSMLNSLEVRVPLLDRKVVELAFQIPPGFKIRGKDQKYILKDTFRDLLPDGIMKKTKQGFAVPIGEWFKGPLKGELQKVLSRDYILEQGILDYSAVETLMSEHRSEKVNHGYALWSLYVFQKWYSNYFLS